jgi:hypothetical protein
MRVPRFDGLHQFLNRLLLVAFGAVFTDQFEGHEGVLGQEPDNENPRTPGVPKFQPPGSRSSSNDSALVLARVLTARAENPLPLPASEGETPVQAERHQFYI